MEGWKKKWKRRLEDWKTGRLGTHPSFHTRFQSLALVLVFIGAIGIPSLPDLLAAELETPPVNDNSPRTKAEQSRQILIEVERLKMDLAEKLMKKKQVDLENLTAMMMEDNNIVTVSEVNKAEEAYERAVDVYEQSKLTLQQVELESLKDEWHIIVEKNKTLRIRRWSGNVFNHPAEQFVPRQTR